MRSLDAAAMSSVLLLEPIASFLTSTPPRARPAHGHSLDRAAVPVLADMA
ncbi:hypothetical protein [Methylibium sp.]|nr:hypothetical protein [Methylibium sp.]